MAKNTLMPLRSENEPVDWWFAFKFNTAIYPSEEASEPTNGIFGGHPQGYKHEKGEFSLSYAVADSTSSTLTMGKGDIGASLQDPLGATFNQIYNEDCNYVIWNDQFYGDPIKNGDSPWGHSKGFLAWDNNGDGFVGQVSTPSWPASGNKAHPRKTDGNTLGCVEDDDVMVSQHFFALKLNQQDVKAVLEGLANASAVTDPENLQIVKNGGPNDIQKLVSGLGKKSSSKERSIVTLSSGVRLLSKPSSLHVPTWQMVSATLGGVDLRVASWWESPEIYSTTANTPMKCWDPSLGKPGAVQIATSGSWDGKSIGLTGGAGTNFNHAKIGISMDDSQTLCIFGDMNQQGTINGIDTEKDPCASSQNGRGGLFYIVENKELHTSLTKLLKGDSAPVQ